MKKHRQDRKKRITSRMLAFLMSLVMVSALMMPIGAGATDASNGTAYNTSETAAVEEPETTDPPAESREESSDASAGAQEESADEVADVQEESADSEDDVEADALEESAHSEDDEEADAQDESADSDAGKQEKSADSADDEQRESAGKSGEGSENETDSDASEGKGAQDDQDAKSGDGRSSGNSAATKAKIEEEEDKIVFRTEEVTVVADKAAFNTEVTMTVEPVTDPVQLLKMVSALKEEGGSYTVKAYTVSFYDKDGNEVEPLVPVQVTVNTDVKTPAKSKVVHVKDDDKTEVVEADIDKSGASFELDSFSDIGVAMEVKTMVPGSSFELYLDSELTTEYEVGDLPAGPILAEELPEIDGYEYENATVEEALVEEIGTITDAEGNVYVYYTTKDESGKISAAILGDGRIRINLVRTEVDTSYDLDAEGVHVHVEAPAGAFAPGTYMEIELVELTREQADRVKDQAARKLKLDEDEQVKIRAVDISFYDKDGEKVQPGEAVEVKLTMPEAAQGSFCVVHLGDDDTAERVTSRQSEDGTICFQAKSFSVYAVVEGDSSDVATMALEFYNGDKKIATMYVKNDDTAEELEYIVYDPGAGTLDPGESFIGWILDKPDYTSADVATAWTIDDVRAWAERRTIVGGETHRFDAAVCKFYHVTYQDDDEENVKLGMVSVPVKADEYGTATVPYTVNMAYTPKDDIHNFEGWYAEDISNITSVVPDDRIYQNGTGIEIKGDVTFTVNAPEGAWLIFDENGKGGKYNAPQFVKSSSVTRQPCADADMTRNGYTFGGWYDTKEHADAHSANPSVTTGKFEFGNELSQKTTIYASWIPNARAKYTVIFWTQNQDRTAYEVAGSYVNENGVVGQSIPYTVRENKDEDYVEGCGAGNGHYTGFCLKEGDKNQQITITPEGDAVLNLHYDRIEYNFKFYLYRDGTQNRRYDYANNSGGGSDLNGLVTWHSNQTAHPGVSAGSGFTIQSETVSGRTYYYFVMSAYYGEDIRDKWPTYDKITGANGREAVSYVMMVGTKLKPRPTSSGTGTVKGLITVLDENILGATNDADGNYVIVRFPGSFYNWRYHIWFETVEGEDYTGKTLHTHNGKTYYEETVLVVRSSNTTDANQNEPKYTGFDYINRMGWNNRHTEWQGGNWTTTEGGTTLYHLNYIYNRQSFNISYFDGNYVDGEGNTIQNRASNLLHESDEIVQGASIPQSDREYVPAAPEKGYVFAGWYLDEGCTTPYTWNTMPVGGIKVYAKWVREEYRIFFHPNAGTDPTLDWGSETVSTSFRADYGEKISLPTGTRAGSGYEFVGWYTDPNFSSSSLFSSDKELNEETVTADYDKTEDTELDKWGNPTQPGNKDKDPNLDGDYSDERFWITKKLDLYAKWRKILVGASGIQVVYTATDNSGHTGTNAPVDSTLYPDQSETTAQAACTAPEGMEFKYWVIQKWDEVQGKYVDTNITKAPGAKFTVDEELARRAADPEHPGSYIYTIQLRPEYAEPESEIPTHIWWFKNYSDTGAERHASFHQDIPLLINSPVDIQAAPTRPGYKFLGWARVPVTTTESAEGTPPTGKVLDLGPDDLYLKYENGQYTVNFSGDEHYGRVVTHVAADERTSYHDMYAVWEKTGVNIDVTKRVTGNMGDVTRSFTFTAVMTDGSAFPDQDAGSGITLSNDKKTATFSLKHGESVTIAGVPSMAAMMITESNADGYVTTAEGISGGSLSGRTYSFTVPDEDGAVTFTNNKTVEVDTGIRLDFLPYVLLLGMTAVGAIWILRRRREV